MISPPINQYEIFNSLRDSLETDYKKAVDYREKFARIQKENELLQRDKKISIVNIKNLELKNQNYNIPVVHYKKGYS